MFVARKRRKYELEWPGTGRKQGDTLGWGVREARGKGMKRHLLETNVRSTTSAEDFAAKKSEEYCSSRRYSGNLRGKVKLMKKTDP